MLCDSLFVAFLRCVALSWPAGASAYGRIVIRSEREGKKKALSGLAIWTGPYIESMSPVPPFPLSPKYLVVSLTHTEHTHTHLSRYPLASSISFCFRWGSLTRPPFVSYPNQAVWSVESFSFILFFFCFFSYNILFLSSCFFWVCENNGQYWHQSTTLEKKSVLGYILWVRFS